MNFRFSDEQNRVRRMVCDFAQNEITPFVKRMEAGEFPATILAKMGGLGLMGMTAPEQLGGAGMDFISYIIAIHEISKVSPAVGVILSVHTSLATNILLSFGTGRQKQKYVPKLASGSFLGAFALTEPGAGSDCAGLKSRAVKTEDGYSVNGSKMFITNGGEADVYIVFASTDPDKRNKGISAFIVEKGTAGLIIGKDEHKMGLSGSRTTQLIFENMKVPAENLIGGEGEGFAIAMANLNAGRIGIAAQALGIAEGAFEYALKYAGERVQFGRPISRQQGIGFKLSEMATAIEAAKMLVYQAAYLKAAGRPCAKEASMAKLFASKTAVQVTAVSVQVYGGYGYTKDYPVERYFRDAKVTEIYEGTSEIQRLVISKHL